MSGNNSKRPSPPSTGNAEPAKDESPGAAQGQSIQKNANDGGGGGDGTVNGGTDSNRGHNNNNNNDANANENENENEQKATVSINSNSNNSTLANSNQNANNEHEANNENKNSSSTTTTTTTTNVNVNISPNPAQNTTTSTTTTTNPNNSSNSLSSSSKKRKKKVQIACIFCRRSHMICDDKRPCTRCVKRNISHLCRDEPINSRQKKLKSPSVGAAAAGQQLLVQPPIVQPAVGGEYGQPVGQPVGQLMGQAFGQTVAQPVTGQPVTGHSLAAQPPNAHVSVQQQQQQPGEIRASESPSGTGYSHGNNANSNEPATGVDAGGLAQSDPNLENSNRNGNNNSHGNANGDKIKPEHEFNGVSGIGGISGGHSSLNNLYSTFAAPQQQNQQQQQQQQQPSPSNNTTTSPAVQPVSSETAQNLDNTNNNNNPTTTTTTNATTTTTTTTTTNHNSSNNNTASNSSNSFGFANNVPSNSGISLLSQLHPFTNQTNPFFYSEHANSEFSSLNEFLSMIDDPDVVNSVNSQYGKNLSQSNSFTDLTNLQSSSVARRGAGAAANGNNGANYSLFGGDPSSGSNGNNGQYLDGGSNTNGLNNQLSSISENAVIGSNGNNATASNNNTNNNTNTTNNNNDNNINNNNGGFSSAVNPTTANNNIKQQSEIPMISDSAKDKFFLTAADPSTEITPEERLKQVIKAKLDAGLLQPYNYAKGYARLQNYMDNYMNQQSRQRILKPLSIFRPAFRAIARTLKDVDLVLVEEAFERMLLDYDRVFTSMAIPACLWRRTGEIYRGNKEFAQLVEVNADALKDGKLTIYELMSEESAVNFWEKYGAIAFDKGQKAVLTSCNLRTKDGRKRKSCCFSFTIRRDRYNIPSCIVGNFIPLDN